eukprot:8177381-Alexandrium_andersonii.AAC.2
MDICYKRLANMKEDSITETLLQVEEAAELLEKSDIQELQAEQKQVKASFESIQTYSQAYQAKKASCSKKEPAELAQIRKKNLQAPKLESRVEQADMKVYLPPGASLWKGGVKGNWSGHYPPNKRISCPWQGDEQAAAFSVIRRLWLQYLERQ